MKTVVAKLMVLFFLLSWGACGLLAQSGTKKAFIDKRTLYLTCSCGKREIHCYQTKKDGTSYYACPSCGNEWKTEYFSFEPIYMGKHRCSTEKECLRLHKINAGNHTSYCITRFCRTTSPLNVTVIIGNKKVVYTMDKVKNKIEFKTGYTGTINIEYGPAANANAKANTTAKTPANKHSARNPILRK